MSYETDAAKRYKDHAEELRVIAHDSMHEKTRRTLLAIARDYEEMAVTLLDIEHTNLSAKKRRPTAP